MNNTFRRESREIPRDCSRCKRPLLREGLPLTYIVKTYTASIDSVQAAGRSAAHAALDGIPGLGIIYGQTYLEFAPPEPVDNGRGGNGALPAEYVLCWRCMGGLNAWILEGPDEDEARELDEIDEAMRA